MCHAAAIACLSRVICCSLLLPHAPARADENDRDQFEAKAVARSTERAVRAIKSDRVQWVKELEAAFPNQVGNPMKDEEYGAWYKLVAGDAAEWRRADAPTKAVAELFDRAVQKMELGPVPSIKKEEFMRYARRVLAQGNPPSDADRHEEPDKVFRVLDRDGDGALQPPELTAKLREDLAIADGDGNGRVDKDEYRAYYHRRVNATADATAKAGDPKAPAAKAGLPDWFKDLDADKDSQVALFEWRKGGKTIESFMKMDLDGDGLLTKEEYARFVKLSEAAPPPPAKP